ncbi:hypothetical protein TNCT_535281 [Trichonephila clavata]|uniref:Uncharacterized protein n=1 Tax=Trichonephila clavata TaxID=2740835 RepID=A0A8X6LP40_TRICU|nr:hypothetical protein TNCT_535281 [Trichonephila clavata]
MDTKRRKIVSCSLAKNAVIVGSRQKYPGCICVNGSCKERTLIPVSQYMFISTMKRPSSGKMCSTSTVFMSELIRTRILCNATMFYIQCIDWDYQWLIAGVVYTTISFQRSKRPHISKYLRTRF